MASNSKYKERIRAYFLKYKKEFTVVLSLFILFFFYNKYKKWQRETNEKITYGNIYRIKNASKGYHYIFYYFILDNGDTIKDSKHIYINNKSEKYYLSKPFLIKYYATDPSNNHIVLD